MGASTGCVGFHARRVVVPSDVGAHTATYGAAMRCSWVIVRAGSVAAVAAVALLGAAGVADAGPSATKRYTVSVTYDGSYEEHWSRIYPDGQGTEWHDWKESASYIARSVRPFTIRRSADRRSFSLDGTLTASFSAVGSGLHGSYGDYAGDNTSDPQTCLRVSAMRSGSGASVPGRVVMRPGDRKLAAGVWSDDPDRVTYTHELRCSPSGFTWTGGLATSWGATTGGWEVDATRLRKHFGHAFTITSNFNYDIGVDGTLAPNRNRMVLRFTPVGGTADDDEDDERERWHVEVTGMDRWSWGMYTTLGAGIWVKWAHRTTLEIKDGEIVSATGKVRILRVTPFTDVPGAFIVTNVRTTAPGRYAIPKRSLSKNRVRLGVLKPGASEYRADFTVQAGPRLLDALRAMGVPDSQARYDAMVARGGVPNTAVPLVPADPQVTALLRPGITPRPTDAFNRTLPCAQFQGSEPDCQLMRGAELVEVSGG